MALQRNNDFPILLIGDDAAELFSGLGNTDQLYGNGGDDTLLGGEGNDRLYGGADNDRLQGDGGDDTLDGGEGNDVLHGGSGNDTFTDTLGNNTYLFARGDGRDLIAGGPRQAGAANVIEFAAGIAPQDVSLAIVPNAASGNADLVVTIGSERITVASWLGDAIATAPLSGIRFADGTVWSADGFLGHLLIGDAGDNLLKGTTSDDVLEGKAGNDTLEGAGGNDTLSGGDGNDDLHGGSGRNVLDGGRGDDILRDTAGANTIFVFNKGDGADRIADLGPNAVIKFGPGIHASDIMQVNGSASMRFVYANSNGVEDSFVAQVRDGDSNGVPAYVKLEFADRTSRTLDSFIQHAPEANRTVFSFALQEGDLAGMQFADYVFYDSDARDVLHYAMQPVQGGALPAWVSVDADTGAMTMTPGYRDAGDAIFSVTATDTSGQSASVDVTLHVSDLPVAPVAGVPMAEQTAEEQRPFSLVLPSDLFVDEDDDGAGVMTVGALPDWLGFDALTRTLSGTPALPSAGPLAIDVTWTDSAGASATTSFSLNVAAAGSIALRGTAQADVLHGKSNDDHLSGLGGNDQLYGHLGNDVLDGGAGKDTLVGGPGNDSYLVDAQDSVIEEADAGLDQVSSAASLTLPAHVEILTLTGSASVDGRGNGLDNLIKGNGGANQLQGEDGVDLLQGGAGNDILSDTAGRANLFDGGAGNDRLSGGDGNELFFGGKGADSIATGTGADLIVFNRGNGMDTVGASRGGDNILSLGGGIAYADLALRKSGGDLILSAGAGDQITFKGWYAAPGNASLAVLQMVTAASADYVPGSSSPIHDNKIETFDFTALIAHFDQARPASGGTWRMGATLEQFTIGGSDTAAIGGDLAYQYGLNGNLANLAAGPAIALVGMALGGTFQDFLPAGSLNDGSPLLY